jgi:hypothetical protein
MFHLRVCSQSEQSSHQPDIHDNLTDPISPSVLIKNSSRFNNYESRQKKKSDLAKAVTILEHRESICESCYILDVLIFRQESYTTNQLEYNKKSKR